MATIVDGKKRIPFMRGMLVHYLIEHDFDHEDARDVANSVRESLGKADDVCKKDMVQLVDKAIRKKRGAHEVGDLVFWDNRCTMHYAQPYDDKRYTRHMHRTTVQGDRPA